MAARLDWLFERLNDRLPWQQSRQRFEVFSDRLAGASEATAVEQSFLQQVLHQRGSAADRLQVGHDPLAARLEVRDERDAVGGLLKIVDCQFESGCSCDRDEVQYGVRRAAGCHDDDHRVLDRLASDDVAWLDVLFEQQPNRRTSSEALVVLQRVFRRDRRTVRQRHPHRFNRRGHRVGRVHATARAGSGNAATHDRLPLLVLHAASDVFAIRLERADDVELLVLIATRLDRAAVNHQRRSVESSHRHDAAGHVLVAAGDRDVRVVPLAAHDSLDAVGDQIARLQRVAHPFGSHRDAVAHADRIEPHPDHPRRLHSLFHFQRQIVEVHVAGVALVPHAGDADLRLVHILFGHAGPVEHGLRRPLRAGLSDA